MAKTKLSDIRAATLGKTRKFRTKLVQLRDSSLPKVDGKHPLILDDGGNAVEVEVREPNLAQRAIVLRNAKAQSGDRNEVDIAALQVEMLLQCTYVPGTSEHVFGEADRAELMSQPAGGFVDDISAEAMPLLNVDTDELAKNSKATGSA